VALLELLVSLSPRFSPSLVRKSVEAGCEVACDVPDQHRGRVAAATPRRGEFGVVELAKALHRACGNVGYSSSIEPMMSLISCSSSSAAHGQAVPDGRITVSSSGWLETRC